GHTDEVWAVAISRDGRRALSGSRDRTARVWDMYTGKPLLLLPHATGVRNVAFSPDGKLVLTSQDRTLHLWDATTGVQLRSLAGHQDIVWCAAFSPDGKQVVSGGGLREDPKGTGFVWGDRDFVVRLWDVDSGREVRRLQGHTNLVSSVAFSPDGRYVMTSGSDKTVRIWEAATGRELRCRRGHTEQARCAVFSPDGRYALSAGGDLVLRCWQLQGSPDALLKALASRDVKELTVAVEGFVALDGSAQRALPPLFEAL